MYYVLFIKLCAILCPKLCTRVMQSGGRAVGIPSPPEGSSYPAPLRGAPTLKVWAKLCMKFSKLYINVVSPFPTEYCVL